MPVWLTGFITASIVAAVILGGISRIGGKSVTLSFRMCHVDTGDTHATYDLVEVFFDPEQRVSTAIPAPVRALLERCTVEVD